MRFVRDLSVRAKLFGGFGVVLVLSAVMGVTLLGELGNVNSGGAYIGKRSVPNIVAAGTIEIDIIDYRRAQLRYALETTAGQKAQARSNWAGDAAQIHTMLAGYGSLLISSRDAELWHSLQSQWSAYLRSTASLEALGASRSTAPAVALMQTTDAAFKDMKATANAWVTLNIGMVGQKLSSNASAYNAARKVGIALLVILIATGLLIAWLVSRQFRAGVLAIQERLEMITGKGADRLKSMLEKLSEGDLTNEINVTTTPVTDFPGDELGDVRRTIEVLRQRVIGAFGAYNKTTARLRAMIGGVADTAASVGSSSQQMADTSEQAGKRPVRLPTRSATSPAAPSAKSR